MNEITKNDTEEALNDASKVEARSQLPVQRPRFKTSTTEQGVDLSISLPGVTKENLTVEIENHRLNVTGVRDAVTGETPTGQPSEARRYQLELKIHSDLDTAEIGARHERGVLVLSLRKKPELARRQIDILPN